MMMRSVLLFAVLVATASSAQCGNGSRKCSEEKPCWSGFECVEGCCEPVPLEEGSLCKTKKFDRSGDCPEGTSCIRARKKGAKHYCKAEEVTPEGSCTVGDSVWENGQSGKLDCNDCQCDNGQLMCTGEVCDPEPATTCEVGDEIWRDGDEGVVGCDECVCRSGYLHCEREDPDCTPALPCVVGGEEVPEGWKGNSGCNECECKDGMLQCEPKECSCYVGEGMEPHQWSGMNGCYECSCNNGEVSCLPTASCPPPEPMMCCFAVATCPAGSVEVIRGSCTPQEFEDRICLDVNECCSGVTCRTSY